MSKRKLGDFFPLGWDDRPGGGSGFLGPESINHANPDPWAKFKGWDNVVWDKDHASVVQPTAVPYSFTVSNVSTGTYDHFAWTKLPDQLTNIVQSGNSLSATWVPTHDQGFDFQITLYDSNNNVLAVRTSLNPRTVVGDILFDGVLTAYTTQQPPTPYTSTTHDTTLTFDAVGLPGGDTSVLSLTVVDTVAIMHERGPHVNYADGNYSGTNNNLTKTYTVGQTASWSYDNVSTGTYDHKSWTLYPSQPSTELGENISGVWDTSVAGTFYHTISLGLYDNTFSLISNASVVVTVIVT